MATNCLYGFKKKGNLKLDYNHFDSYPEGFGNKVVLFIRENTIEELNDIYDNIRLVSSKNYPSDEEIKILEEKNMFYKDSSGLLKWDEILSANGGFLSTYKVPLPYMCDYSHYLEGVPDYLYIIDLDENKFKVYHMCFDENKVCKDFKKQELIMEFELNNIPKDWNI